VDRVATEEGKTLNPSVLLFGDDKKTELSPKGVTVTARVVGHVKGEKIRIGKYRRRTGYRRHTGYRSSLTQIEITAIGAKRSTAAKKPAASSEKASASAEKPAASAEKKPAARKPASTTKKKEET